MPYTATIKHIPEQAIYCKECNMASFRDYSTELPAPGDALRAKCLNLKCATLPILLHREPALRYQAGRRRGMG